MLVIASRPRQALPAAAARILWVAALLWLALAGSARAEVTVLEGVQTPIVRIVVRHGDVTIRTWDRNEVAIDGDPALEIERKGSRTLADTSPILIPQLFVPGSGEGASLAAESFVVSIPPGPHEQIVVRTPLLMALGGPPTSVTVTVPKTAVFIFARAANGNLEVHDYRGGALVGFVGRGHLELDSVGGTVFAQTAQGPLTAYDSSFDHLRARSLFGNVTLESCRVRQIEATTVDGSIVYDGGTFDPGLARFESRRGDIAIGTAGDVEVGAHTAGAGRVYTNFERGARLEGAEGEASAVVGGGGPLVTATTQGGDVFLYDGSLRNRTRPLSGPWQAPLRILQRPAQMRRGSARPFAPPRSLFGPFNLPPRPAPGPWDRFKSPLPVATPRGARAADTSPHSPRAPQ